MRSGPGQGSSQDFLENNSRFLRKNFIGRVGWSDAGGDIHNPGINRPGNGLPGNLFWGVKELLHALSSLFFTGSGDVHGTSEYG
jgi:hypothetical protein